MPGVFDYEVIGPGLLPGWSHDGDSFYYAPVRGTNLNLQRVSMANQHSESGHVPPVIGVVGGGNIVVDTNSVTSSSAAQHVVVTYVKDADGPGPGTVPRITVYRNGAQTGMALGTDATAFQLENLNDVNNWLGRSNYPADSMFGGSLHEFRIFDRAFTAGEVGRCFLCGGNGCGSAGDYNLDGRVDAADYVVYRNRRAGIGGTELPVAADPTPGVGVDDYVRWKNLYGVKYESPIILVADVPEPAILVSILSAIVFGSGMIRAAQIRCAAGVGVS